MTTEAYLARGRRREFATQSGPMLVIDGKIHPAFIEGSTDLKAARRRGVCEPDGGAFRHQRGPGEFPRFRPLLPRRARLRNALFLDGGIRARHLFAGARPQRRARPRRLRADHRRGRVEPASRAAASTRAPRPTPSLPELLPTLFRQPRRALSGMRVDPALRGQCVASAAPTGPATWSAARSSRGRAGRGAPVRRGGRGRRRAREERKPSGVNSPPSSSEL